MRLEDNDDQSNQDASQPPRPYSNGSNGSSMNTPVKPPQSHSNGSSSKADSNGYTNGHSRPTGPFFGHDREEVTRILIQSLTDLGYHGAAGSLSRESGYELENPSVAAFRSAVQDGEWAEAESLLFGTKVPDDGGVGLGDSAAGWLRTGKAPVSTNGHSNGLPLAEGANKQEMLFWIRQQKYLELLEERDLGSALMVLRQELTPLHQDTSRLHALSR